MGLNINQLSSVDSLAGGDQFVVWPPSQGDTRKVSLTAIQQYLQDNLTFSDTFTTERASPSSTGFTVSLDDGGNSRWLILTPTGGFAAGTIQLPAVASVVDRQEILVNTTQAVTALTVDGNGASGVIGAPTTISANGFFRMKYDATNDAWYRLG